MGTEVIVGIIAAIAGLGTGAIGFMGKISEGVSQRTTALLERYEERVEKLENRQNVLETKLDEVRAELRRTQAHNSRFHRALSGALEWIGDAVEWMQGARDTPHPAAPDTREWRELLKNVD